MSINNQTQMNSLEAVAAPAYSDRKASRAARWLAWSLWALALAQAGLGVLLGLMNQLSVQRFFGEYIVASVVATLAFACVGVLIAIRRPANIMSWLICATGVVGGLGAWTGQYARYTFVTRPGALPFGELAAWLYISLAFGPFVALTAIFVPLLFPAGRLPSPRWRPIGWLAALASVLFTLNLALSPGPIDASLPEVANPFAPAGIEGVLRILEPIGIGLMLVSMVAAIAAVVVRLRRARGIERQQVKWFAYATSVLVAAIVVPGAIYYPDFNTDSILVSGVALTIALPLLPLSIGIAILRYRLWDIDILINRTLVYGALTTCVVGLYVLVVGYLGALFHAEGNLPISLIATGVVALLFQPLRAWLQRGINRLLYGERDDPYAVVARLGQRLEATLAPDAVLPTLVETVAAALKLPYAAVMLKLADGFVTAAEYPGRETRRQGDKETRQLDERVSLSSDLLVSLPLTYQGEVVGKLLLAPRTPGEPFTPADRRLLDVLARQAGVAAHAVRLTRDLQQISADLQLAREHLISAREEERRRIRRDLHDGVGPVLSSLIQRLDLARGMVRRDPDAAAALLDTLKGQVRATLADIRSLVYALRPPALDEFGLVAAIGEQAAHYQRPDRLQIEIDTPEPLPPLPAAVEVAAYRIALEALTNMARHSQARHCRIALTLVGVDARQVLCLEVHDDGIGLPSDARAGVGLSSMRERAAELGGTCTIERAAQGGTRVCAWLPITL